MMEEGEISRLKTRCSKLEYEAEAATEKIRRLETSRIILYLLSVFLSVINLLLSVIIAGAT